ncbi:serine protease [Candidatus Paraluminiphilus aquimaris]|uniref:Serine protease n=1 Tax=Candidatus Paraluminiphilus aquimaris TaxID=2518994 RepID=A0ABY6Q7T9_9GAMM|nr:S8 family serine peptidase [Candidatus Paraluminiphilus aquimaris]UZP74328.1 serine protease [Candidatus Paraluminiphilus aquimaris]
MRFVKVVSLGLLFSAIAYAQEPLNGQDGSDAKPDAEIGIAEPDLHFLKRMRTFRGPYTDQDDPLLTAKQAKEADRTGVTAAELTCRPPHCSREEALLIVKLATPASSQILAKTPNLGTKQSAFYVDSALTPIFSQELVSKARTKYAASSAKQPVNSLGKPVDLSRWHSLKLPKGTNLDEAIKDLSLDPRIELVESSFERQLKGEPTSKDPGTDFSGLAIAANDPRKAEQWALERTRTEDAWQWLEDNGYPAWGDRNIVVAVIDSGVDYTHEDLAGNMWVNAGEIPDNNIDDDNNSFIDDVYGADVVGSTYDHDGDPQDDNGHGTHVAGIIAAQGNNDIGIIGVAPNSQIMAIKAAQYSGVLTSTDIAEAILYAYQQGADIINMSFGGSGRSVLEEEALAVAFSNAVLIAAAGNQGIYNDTNCGILARPSYPAAHPYVLGVMAEAQFPDDKGAYLARFSNWDCKARNGIEYEVMAPGVDILSTIPGDGYAAWDGTSMAAPVVAGMAALVRTRFEDKSVYSSRFIMGQLGSTGASRKAIAFDDGSSKSYFSADALQSLVNVPSPSLSYLQHYLFDGSDQGASNDDDGIADAGETIEVAIVVKNYWGMADNVEVTLEAQAEGAVAGPDPYVTWDVPTVNYGGVGSFNEDDNGLIYDEGGLITGVRVPFRFTVAENTPNEHIIPMLVTMTANNGLDPDDPESYTTTSRFNLIVQRGRELPSIIGSDAPGTPGGNLDTDGVEDGIVTLDDSALWLVEKPVLVETGAHLRVGPGAILQFGNNQADDVYAEIQRIFLQYNGTFETAGTAENPVTIKPSDLFPQTGAVITRSVDMGGGSSGTATFQYTNLFNPIVDGKSADHVSVTRTILNGDVIYRTGEYRDSSCNPRFNMYDYESQNSGGVTNSRFRRLGQESWGYYDNGVKPVGGCSWSLGASRVASSLIENTMLSGFPTGNSSKVSGTVLLNNNQRWVLGDGSYITKGSDFYLNEPQISDLLVLDTHQFDGKTYALIYSFMENEYGSGVQQINNVDRVAALARALEGELFIPSDDAEISGVQPWLQQVREDMNTASKAGEFTGIDCGTWDEVCERLRDPSVFSMGFIYADGVIKTVTGETPTYENPNNPMSEQFLTDLENANRTDGYLTYYVYCDSLQCMDAYRTGTSLAVVELPHQIDKSQLQIEINDAAVSYSSNTLGGNAVLNQWHDPNIYHWARVRLPSTSTEKTFFNSVIDLSGVYWGDVSEEVIRLGIADYQSDFNKMPVRLQPIRTEPPENAYPFVAKLDVLDADANERPDQRFANEQTVWRVTFNRDMNQEIQPFVTFGPDEPYTDFIVPGDWVDARTWEGRVTISPVATDGYQYVRVAGAVAADDPWLITGDDKRRFRFEVITSGTESLNLQASGGEGYVDLSWNQDDYDTLMGFNIYRSTSQDGNYVRINQTLVGNEDREYRDSNTEPGVQYFYYFTVALDGSESEPSNKASATPIDTVKPVMSHNIISTATFGSTVMVQANVTDNISVQSVTLYYRAIGETNYTSADMVNTSGSTYRASILASATQPPGVEYYIAATDGSSYTYSGRASSPNKITIENNPVVTSVSPSAGSTAGGEVITVSGNNFVDGAKITLGSATCQNVVWASESRLTCTTPASSPNLVAVTVENPDGGTGVLTSAFTFVGNSTTMALPDITASQGQTRDVALTVDPVTGMQSFTAVISWNGDHLQYAGFTKGALVSGWDVVSQLNGTTLTIAGSSSTSVSGSGELVLLEFAVIAEGDVNSVIDLVSAKINEGYIETALVDGSFTMATGFDISGRVRFWDSSRTPIEATVTLDNSLEEVSDAVTGQFQFSGVLDGTHTLNIEKEDGINDSVRGYDASLILSHVVGSATLTGSALAAADVTGNGEISALDASKVLEVAAGLETVPFANQASPWAFEPAERRYDEITSNITNADFTAIFMGDVSGNWGDLSTQSLTGVRLELDSVTREGVATVNVLAAPPVEGAAISSVELTLNTTAGVSLIQASRTPATTNWSEPLVTVGDNAFSTIIYDDVSGAFSTETHVLSLELSLTNGQQAVTSMGGWLNEMQLYSSQAFALKSANDTDGDFVDDDEDAFPSDPSASTDTDGDGLPDDWNPGYTALDSTTGLLVDRDDDNDGYTDKEEEEAGTDSLDAGDQPVSGMGILLIKQAIDAAAARGQ